jgi:hypothetical protein
MGREAGEVESHLSLPFVLTVVEQDHFHRERIAFLGDGLVFGNDNQHFMNQADQFLGQVQGVNAAA